MRLFLAFLFLGFGSFYGVSSNLLIFKNKVAQIEPSNEALAQIKNIIRPIGISTGVPEINIPIYTNADNYINLNLSYHGGGIKNSERASSVGLGWILEGGGLVTRIVRGLPDDNSNGYLNMSTSKFQFLQKELNENYTTQELDDFSTSVEGNYTDPSPDIFFFKFNGYQGKFFIDRNKKVHSIEKSNLKFAVIFQDTNGIISSFTITTPDGISYIFSEKETMELNPAQNGVTSYYSSWFLKEIKTHSQVLCSFDYVLRKYSEIRQTAEYKFPNSSNNFTYKTESHTVTTNAKKIKRIAWSSGKIDFYYYDSSIFETESNPFGPNIGNSIFLRKLEIFNDLASPASSSYLFNFCNFNNISSSFNSLRDIKLTSIIEKIDNISKTINFEYNPQSLPDEYSKQQDLWGYYNGNNSNSLIPQTYLSNGVISILPILGGTTIYGANRMVNSEKIIVGQLKKVIYPGGKTDEYIFEPNSFEHNGSLLLGGGLRIAEKKTYTTSDPANYSSISYYYTKNKITGTTSGQLNYIPEGTVRFPNNPFVSILPTDLQCSISTCYYSNNYISGDYSIPPVFYNEVTIDLKNDGYITYKFEKGLDYNFWLNSGVIPGLFPTTHEKTFSNITSSLNLYFGHLNQIGHPQPKNPLYDWSEDYLSSEDYYNKEGIIKKKVVYEYYPPENITKCNSYRIFPNYDFRYETTSSGVVSGKEHFLGKYFYLSAWKSLKSKKEYFYNDLGQQVLTSYDELDYTSGNWRYVKNHSQYLDGRKIITNKSYAFEEKYNIPLILRSSIQQFQECALFNKDFYQTYNSESYPRETLEGDPTCYNNYHNSISNTVTNEVAAIAALQDKHQLNTIIETVQLLIENGDTCVINGSLTTFDLAQNGDIVKKREYSLKKKNFSKSSFTYSHNSNISNKYSLILSDQYEIVFENDIINEKGFPVQFHYKDNIPISRIFSSKGELLVEGFNITYNTLKNEAENMLRSKYPNARFKTYKYHPNYGLIEEVDERGRSMYYIFDVAGNQVAIKDNEKNIIKAIVRNSGVWGQYKVDNTTNPNNDTYGDILLTSLNKELLRNISTTYYVHNPLKGTLFYFDPQLEYTIDYGDGAIVNLTNPNFSHKYNSLGNFNITITCKSNNVILKQESKLITILLAYPLKVDFRYVYGTSSSIISPPSLAESLRIEVSPNFGYGNYTITWNVKCTFTDPQSNPSGIFTNTCFANQTISRSFTIPGRYSVICTITDGKETITKTWSFRLSSSIIP
jgi:hypothetical protein